MEQREEGNLPEKTYIILGILIPDIWICNLTFRVIYFFEWQRTLEN